MKMIFAFALLFVAAYANEEQYSAGYNPGYYSRCFNGRLLPAYQGPNGPCQLDSDCVIPCQSTCSSAQYPILSSANCLEAQAQQHYKRDVEQQRRRPVKKVVKKTQKKFQHKSCFCCCSNLPQCFGNNVQVTPNFIPGSNLGCSSDLACGAQCLAAAADVCVDPVEFVQGNPSFCVRTVAVNGLSFGSCACCCTVIP